MMRSKNIVLIIAIFLIAGCNSIKVSATPQTTSLVINSVTPDFTLSTPAATSLPKITSTNTLDSRSTDSCFMIVDREASLESIATGTVLIGKGYNYGQSLLDLSTGVKYEVITQSQCGFCVRWALSPDKNLLARTEEVQNNLGKYDKTILWILNTRAKVLKKITFDLLGLYDIRWLDNQNIILHTEQTTKDGTIMIFNPFNGEQHYISNELPDFYTENYFYPTLGWLIEYNPNLEWGIYFGLTQTGKLGYVVRDFTNKETVLQVEDTSGKYQKPVWSPDGDNVAVVISGHPYLINRDGEAKPVLNENQQGQVTQLSWSPNGRFLAFWNYDTLIVYDRQENKVSDTCFKSDIQFPLIWSPGNRQIAVPKYIGDSSALIDVQEKKIYSLISIPDIIYPQEWMNSMP